MKKGKGIVLKLEQDGVVLLGEDGGFYRRPLPHPLPLLGEELEFNMEDEPDSANEGFAGMRRIPWINRAPLRRLGAAALILLIFVGFMLFRPMTPEAAYVVALDINLNLELYVDRQDRVRRVIAYDEETNRFLDGLALNGASIAEAVGEITARAKAAGYLQKPDARVVATVVPLKSEVNKGEIIAKIGHLLSAGDGKEKVILTSTDPKNLDEAHKKNLPVYKYAVLRYLEKNGSKIPVEAKKAPTAQLLEKFNIHPDDLLKSGEILQPESLSTPKNSPDPLTPPKGKTGKEEREGKTKEQGVKGGEGVKEVREKKDRKKEEHGRGVDHGKAEGINRMEEIIKGHVREIVEGKEREEPGKKEEVGKKDEGKKGAEEDRREDKGGEKEKGGEKDKGKERD